MNESTHEKQDDSTHPVPRVTPAVDSPVTAAMNAAVNAAVNAAAAGNEVALDDGVMARSVGPLEPLARQMAGKHAQMVDAFFAIDTDERITAVNDETVRITGQSRSELIGEKLREAFPALRQSPFAERYQQLLSQREPLAFTEYSPASERWIDVRAFPTPNGYAIYFRDVTEMYRAQVALRASEERFREIAESIEDAFWVWDAQAERVLYVNSSYETIFGIPRATVYADPYHYQKLLPPEDQERLSQAMAQDPYTLDLQYRIVRPDGVTRWIDVRTVPVHAADNTVLRTIGIARDVTPIIQATEQLRANADQYQLLFSHNPHPMYVVDEATRRILAVNDAAQEHYGYSRDEFLSMAMQDLRPAHEQARLARLLAEPPIARYTDVWQHKKRDGSLIDMEVHATKLTFEGRDATLVLALDITERLRHIARIREQAELLDQATDAIVVRDLEQRVTYWNKSAEQLYGWTAAEAIGRPIRELHLQHMREFETATQTLLDQGVWSGEVVQRHRNGEKLFVHARWTLVRNEDGSPRTIFSINTDVTEHKKLEQQFMRAQRLESLGMLAGGIAHDLNNVLSPILLSLGILRMKARTPREQKLLDTLEESAQRGADMVRQVLSFARGVEGERAPVDMVTLLGELHRIMRETFERNLRVVRQVDDDLWHVMGDHTQIHQVLLNLCVNARDAMPDGGTLTLQAQNARLDAAKVDMYPDTRAGDYVCVTVKDSGHGIPPEVLDRIFEPFFTTKEQGKGTGLGLATVQAVIKSHGGLVTVNSDEGKGTEFHVYLPAHTGKTANTSEEAVVDLSRGDGEWVLVVDDEVAVRAITQQTLEAFGYRVLIAEDGTEALALYAQHQAKIAVVLTDLMMPVMDGYATIQALRRINPAVKIIAASGMAANGMPIKGSVDGVQAFLSKPYATETLLSTLLEVLQP